MPPNTRAAKIVEERLKNSLLLDAEKDKLISQFDIEEVKADKVLGRGGYCTVSQVCKIQLRGKSQEENGEVNHVGSRSYMAEHAIRDGEARYAIKKLSKEVVTDPYRFLRGTIDLAIEARFLAVITHSNIIKMRGVGSSDPCGADFFLILDRLYGTLEPKLKEWKKLEAKYNGAMALVRPGWKKTMKNNLICDRLLCAYDLASAMRHMHSLNVIYRDLKPENIGFDIRGDVKIFDLGLAKEVQPLEAVNGVYKLTGNTGSPRYMAPEVAKNEPYNLSADVYSYGVIFWQIFTLGIPYQGYTCKMHAELVIGKGYRPKITEKMPQAFARLCKSCWSVSIDDRPTFEEICDILAEEINAFRNDDDTEMRPLDQTGKSAVSA